MEAASAIIPPTRNTVLTLVSRSCGESLEWLLTEHSAICGQSRVRNLVESSHKIAVGRNTWQRGVFE